MSNAIVIDVETYGTRNPDAIARIMAEEMARTPAQNAKKELKLAWNTELAQEARIKEALGRTAVDPLLAEPLCVCWRVFSGGDADSVAMMEDWDTPEGQLTVLAERLDIAATDETVWVGHNVEGFDLGVLLNSWRRYDIKPPGHFPVYRNRRWRGWVYDTMLRAPCKNGLNMVSLDKVCEAYGISGKELLWNGQKMDGSRVAEAFEARAYGAIVEHCMLDVDVEYQLYLRMTCNGTYGTYDTEMAGVLAGMDPKAAAAAGRLLAALG